MARLLHLASMIWLVAVVCFAWGAAMVQYQIFPYRTLKPTVKELVAFWRGEPSDRRPVEQRLWGSLTADPASFALVPVPFPIDLGFKPVDRSSYRGPNVQFLENARYYSDGSLKEYFLIFGGFGFDDAVWGAILLSSEGHVLRAWPIKPDQAEYDYPGPHLGLALSKSGDIATNVNGVLTSYSWCGKKNWEAKWEKQAEWRDFDSVLSTDYHHDVSYHEGRFYTFLGPEIVSVAEQTGNIEARIHGVDLIRMARDQDLALFDARFLKDFTASELSKKSLASFTFEDAFHFNKVDVLSPEFARSFEIFEAGDMLVSMREHNLVFVFRPKTEKVLWYRYGLTSRQHDATFQRGYISVFDNNPHANTGSSPRIVSLEVNDHTRSVLFDLRMWGAEMREKGNFEFDDDTRLLAFSDDDNGRAVVGNLAGKPMFVFENSIGSGKILPLRNITRVSEREFEEWSAKCG